MSEDLQLQVTKLIDKEVENKRRAGWAGFGVELYHSEIALQVQQQLIEKKLITPTSPDQIALAEQALAIVKKDLEALVDKRKTITSRFDKVAQRLMQYEKSLNSAIAANVDAILNEKKKFTEAQKTKEAKEKELKEVAAYTRQYVADMHEAYLRAQLKLLSDSYEYALAKEIPVTEINTYIAKVSARINVSNCIIPRPKPPFRFNAPEDVEAEVTKNFNPWTPEQYVNGFALDIKNKFDDWALALKNKQQAAEINKRDSEETLAAIVDQKDKETLTIKLESTAVDIQTQPDIKPLKESYKLAEPETMDEADIIINAYIINKKLCREKLRKITPVNFGVKQMIAALEAIKNDDNNFEFTGLKFTIVEKL